MPAPDPTIYLAPHFPNFPNPVRSPAFKSSYEKCRVFILEWAAPWQTYEPELELSFNMLSRGQVQWVRSRLALRLGGDLPPFDRELQGVIRGSNRKIVLERTNAEYVYVPEADIMNLATSKRLNDATTLFKTKLEELTRNIVSRDNDLVEIFREEGKKERRLFAFRGADHETYLRSLLDQKSISAQWLTYEERPLLRRLICSLTMGEQVADIDVQRVIYAMTHRTSDDYLGFVSLQKQAESLSEQEITQAF